MDLMTTRSNEFIDLNDINTKYRYKIKTPSIFNTRQNDTTSDRYQVFSTMDAINRLDKHGYLPTQIKQAYSRKNPYPEIILYNNHQGEQALSLLLGCYRLVCDNGHVSGYGTNQKLKHFQSNKNIFDAMVQETIDGINKMNNIIDRLKSVDLTDNQIYDLTKNTMQNRWEYANSEQDMQKDEFTNQLISKAYFNDDTIKQVSTPNRVEDSGKNGWRVFNTIQENFSKPLSIFSVSKQSKTANIRQSKALMSIDDNKEINLAMWKYAEEILA
jgi:hypothetical protein